jgi:hypothetical protein
MRYLVRARVKPGREGDLLHAIEQETLGCGSVAEGEYLRNMQDARLYPDETARWVEICYCPTPLQEERPYWEEFFDLTRVQDAHDRRKCEDERKPALGLQQLRLHSAAGTKIEVVWIEFPGTVVWVATSLRMTNQTDQSRALALALSAVLWIFSRLGEIGVGTF